jgi:hypothetical protein
MRVAIEQNPSILLASYPANYPFDYDLDSPGFLQYFQDRTGYMIGENVAEYEYTNTDGRRIKPCGFNEVKKYQAINYIWEITRAKIQDCWFIWIQPGYQEQRGV